MKKLTVEQYIESINTYRRHGTLGEELLQELYAYTVEELLELINDELEEA